MTNVGYATLDVVPSLKGFEGQLTKGTRPGLLSSGRSGGTLFGDTAGKSAGARFGSVFKSAAKAGIVGGIALAAGAIKVGADAISAAQESQKIGRQTNAVIKSTGGASKITADEVGKLSSELSYLAGVDDELVQSSANVLLTFKNIRNEQGKNNKIFDRGAKVALNMSTALGTDLKGASIQVGKALNDPVKGIAALARVGVTFTTKQKAQIKALVEGGDANAAMALGLIDTTTTYTNLMKENGGNVQKVADILTKDLNPAQKKSFDMYAEGNHTIEAQKRILKELGSEFGGSARSQATASDRLKVAFGNVQESLGKGLLPIVQDFSRYLLREGVPAAQDFTRWFNKEGIPAIKDLGRKLRPLADELLPAAKDGFKGIKEFAEDALPFAEGIVKSFNDMPGWVKKVLAGGVVGGTIAVKLGGTELFKRGATPLTPMYVSAVGGGLGGPGGKTGFLSKLGIFGEVLTPAAIGLNELHDFHRGDDKNGLASLGRGGLNDWFDEKVLGKKSQAQLEALQSEWDETRNRANDYFTLIERNKDVQLRFTVAGMDLATQKARDYYSLLLQIRGAVNENKLDAAGGSGPTQPSSGKGGNDGFSAAGRSVTVNNNFNVNTIGDAEKFDKHRRQQVAMGGFG